MGNKERFVWIGLLLCVIAITVSGGILAYQYWWLPKLSQKVKLPEKLNCASLDLAGYKVIKEFFVDLNNDKQNELVRVYAQDVEDEFTAELPIVVKIFSGTAGCYKEEFTYPSTLTPITDFADERYNLVTNAQLMKNFWGDGRDVIVVLASLNFCGSGTRSQLLFFTYQNGKYVKIDGPAFRGELDDYFMSSYSPGKAILVAQAKWEKGETHFGPHRYSFVLYEWNGQGYEEREIGTTNNKYDIDDKNFQIILQKINTVFQNEPEKLRSEIEKL